jgi:hypothetical protein
MLQVQVLSQNLLETPNNFAVWNHNAVHHEVLALKCIPSNLTEILTEILKFVIYIEGHSVNSRVSEGFCSEMRANHTHLHYHTEFIGC